MLIDSTPMCVALQASKIDHRSEMIFRYALRCCELNPTTYGDDAMRMRYLLAMSIKDAPDSDKQDEVRYTV